MAKTRKDAKGRVLNTGESQRKDGIYQYRYTDIRGKRQAIYSSSLNTLREKEREVNRLLRIGVDYCEGNITVLELVKRYIKLKTGVRHNTKIGYNTVLRMLEKEDFAYRSINSIRTSDAQLWIIKLHEDGRRYSTITTIRGVLKPAFQMAYDDDIILKNPFDFKLVDIVPNDSIPRFALTDEQLNTWLNFVKNDSTYSKYYDDYIVLLGTGMRVSEYCGLTLDDLDFENRRITVSKQLIRSCTKERYVEETKTDAGKRFIPMTDDVYDSLLNIINNRRNPKIEQIINGYSKFLLLDNNGNPKVALHIENSIRLGLKKYSKLHPNEPLPNITPHVLRHTFCTKMANRGCDLKGLQYLMGHSDASVTMNVYTHASYEHAVEQFAKVVKFNDFLPSKMPG